MISVGQKVYQSVSWSVHKLVHYLKSSSQIECGCHRLKFVTSFNKFLDQKKVVQTKLCRMLDTVRKKQPPGSCNHFSCISLFFPNHE